jgi:integrase
VGNRGHTAITAPRIAVTATPVTTEVRIHHGTTALPKGGSRPHRTSARIPTVSFVRESPPVRQPVEHDTVNGKRYRVRFRQGGTETSETFRVKRDANTFAAILDGGGVTDALAWLHARDNRATDMTFGKWFAEYVDQLTGVTLRTRESYRSLHRNHLAHLDPTPLPLLTRSHVTELVNRLEANGKSPKTIRNVVHMLSSCLALAIDEGHMTRNPCRRVKITKQALTDTDPRFLTETEFARLLAQIPGHYRPLVVFLVGTGLRWSEATALQCRHVNLTAGTILVRQAWKEQGGRELGPPKTEKGRRTVNPATMALRAAQTVMRDPDDWLFTTPTGKIVRHSNFYNRVWVPACEKAGIKVTIHDLRATHASWLISDGISLEAVQDQLGHSSILTTRKIYGHLLPAIGVEVGKSASAALDRALPDGMQAQLLRVPLAQVRAVSGPDEGAHPDHVRADV